MSAAVIADLVGAMHAAVTAVDADNARHPWLADRKHPDQFVFAGECMLSGWSEIPQRAERPAGRYATMCRPLSELRAVGWQILPIPVLREWAELLGPRMSWVGNLEWLVIPPESRGLKARRFKGPALAQVWATECETAAGIDGIASDGTR